MQNLYIELGLEVLCTNKITKPFIYCHKIEQTDKTETKLILDCQNAIINLDCQDTYRVHLKSHRLMRMAFLLYEKAMRIFYAYLFT